MRASGPSGTTLAPGPVARYGRTGRQRIGRTRTGTRRPAPAARRRALIQDLEKLPAPQWATPSPCPGRGVHDVLAHLVDDAKTTRPGFLRDLLAAGFDFDRLNARGVARERREDPKRTLAGFRAVSRRTTSAPAPSATRLVEAFVHGEDIRRPLGIRRDYPTAHVATDTELGVGAGDEVRGSAIALLLAVSGRPVGPEELTGPGAVPLMR